MQLRELSNDEFERFADSYKDYSMYQTKEYSFIMHKENFETSMVGLFDNNTLIGAALILFTPAIYRINGRFS